MGSQLELLLVLRVVCCISDALGADDDEKCVEDISGEERSVSS